MARRRRKKSEENNASEVLLMVFCYGLLGFVALGAVSTVILYVIDWWQRVGAGSPSLLRLLLLLAVVIVLGVLVSRSKWYKQRQTQTRRRKRYQNTLDEGTVERLLRDYGSNPYEFEQYMACVFYDLGYQKVEVTPPVNDRGKDIVMYRDGRKYVVEVKLYAPQNHIGREKIQKLHSAMIDSDADRAIFVTTSDYTENAVEYAKKFGIETINGDGIEKILGEINDERELKAAAKKAKRREQMKSAIVFSKKTAAKVREHISRNWNGE